MSNNIFDSKNNYVERFINNHSKRIKFPNFKYLDAKFHPKYKDHVVVLSSNEFPEDVKMTYAWESPITSLDHFNDKDAPKIIMSEVENLNAEK